MRFKRSASITIDCFTEVFKLLVYRLVVGLIIMSLMYLILTLGLSFIVKSKEFAAFGDLIPDLLRALSASLTAGDFTPLTEFQESLHGAVMDFASLLVANIGSIVGAIIGVVVVYIASRIVNGVAQFAVASSVHDHMDSCARTRFAVSYFRNLTKATLYELCYVPLAFVYDLLSALASWFLLFYLPAIMPGFGVFSVLFALAFAMTLFLFLQALKLTAISSWMPAMIVDGKSVGSAMKAAFTEKEGFCRRFAGFLIACYLILFFNVGFAFFTVGSGLLVSIPASYFFLMVMQLVNYYEAQKKKYFVSKDVIADLPGEGPEA